MISPISTDSGRPLGVVLFAICCIAVAAAVLGGCNSRTAHASVSIPPDKAIETIPVVDLKTAPTQVEMVNVNLHLDAALVLHIHHLSGQFLPTKEGRPPAFDDKRSYIVAIDSAEVGISAASMTYALNTYVFDAPDAPLRNVTLSIDGDQIKQSGTLTKGGIPFEMTGIISATPDGRIRIHPTKVKAAHLPVEGIMKLFGLKMEKLVNASQTKSMSVEGNDFILDPALMLPPPKMRGRITSVRIQGDQIVQTFGPVRAPRGGQPSGGNYMWYRGGVLRFGKLTMTDADMRLIDADPADPFDFFPDHYQEQLVAGYSKTTATGGLLVYVPDYGKLSKPVQHTAKASGSHRLPGQGLQ